MAILSQRVLITLVGPGGAGKSTIGARLAERLGIDFVDLDRRFADRAGDIGEYIDRLGYRAYATANVDTYVAVLSESGGARVVALSSGFMMYPHDVHPDYSRLRLDVERHPTTFVLIPSLDREICVAETVRRQLTRPFARSAAREEAVIRERFSIYVGLRARQIETMRPVGTIVDDLIMSV
jgi:shikimate kinase